MFVVSPARRSVSVSATVELPPKSRRSRATLNSALSQSGLKSTTLPESSGHGVSSSAERYATLTAPSLPVTFAPGDRRRDLPRVHELVRRVEQLDPLEEERPLLGEEQREPLVHGHEPGVRLDLREVGLHRRVERDGRERDLEVHARRRD